MKARRLPEHSANSLKQEETPLKPITIHRGCCTEASVDLLVYQELRFVEILHFQYCYIFVQQAHLSI